MFGHKNHGYLVLAKKRIAEMEKALSTLKRMVPRASSRSKAKKLLAELKTHRSQFQTIARQMKTHANEADARMKKLSTAGTASWSAFRTAFAKSRKAFVRANHKTERAIKRAVR